ncbi:TetR family transcriptional regulator [Microbacterium sorbitolivorans]|uniref:TetR/AcrR family transcriptional regulator n=1 Tax=Microbacterium sorbitolivorans TaxID=1867410 RepID=A0A367Y5Q2_9MICO|nr:TetR/AcrR family transcriptional regulator [Microbacterium sorbitolivorans]RCK61196.1 TetR/AcrR family transcriptional regulator [Microbacterium sorbitolivorans]GGF34203.1 TetR family transcriptional regulator [Microbacterium sorbitolivorans]
MSATDVTPITPASGTPRGPYSNGIARRRQIIETATKVFGQHGYHGGSLRQIADEIGVSASALIRHFGTKAELFTAVLDHSDSDKTKVSITENRGIAALRSFAAVTHVNVHNRGLVQLLLSTASESTDPSHPAHEFITTRYAHLLEDLSQAFRDACEDGDLRPLTEAEIEHEARGYIAMMDGLGLQWLIDPTMDLEASAEHLYEGMLERLGARHE